MFRYFSKFALVTLGVLALPMASRAAAPPPELPALPEVNSIAGVARLALTAAVDPATNLPALYYGGATTPPTIRIHPGDAIVIEYTNALPAATVAPLDFTNLHFHGLTVSPHQPGDQVIMTMIAPGQTYRYVVKVPAEQAPGLYWYHPHPHGEANRQVASGMSGLIIIDGVARYAPLVRGLAERDVILRDYYLDPGSAPFARVRERSVMHAANALRRERAMSLHDAIRSVGLSAAALPPDNDPDCNPDDANKGVTINGLSKATISMAPGSRQFFRISNASANSFFDLGLEGSKMFVVGVDGVPIGFHDRSSSGYLTDQILLPPGGRVEFINASPLATGAILRSRCIDYGSAGDVDPFHALAVFSLRGTPAVVHADVTSLPNAAPVPPTIGNAPIAAKRLVDFTEDNANSLFYINGKLWDPAAPPMFVAHTGTVEEWTVRNYADELHAFHIHQIHFLVEDIDGVRQPPDTWRDTVVLPYAHHLADGTVRPSVSHLLMDFRDPVIAGTFVFHCHILEHEDGGMMAKIQLLPGGVASAENPFAAFVSASMAFAANLTNRITGRSDALAVLGHMCGLDRTPAYARDDRSEGFVRHPVIRAAVPVRKASTLS